MALLYRDLDPPDYSKALTCLDRAIILRGPLTIGEPWQYELNRAAIRIQQTSKTTRVSDFSPFVQENIIADLLVIAQVYNLETVLQAAEDRHIPAPIEDWLRLNRAYLATRDDTRTVAKAVSRVLGLQLTAPAVEETRSKTVGSTKIEASDLPPVGDPTTDVDSLTSNGQKPAQTEVVSAAENGVSTNAVNERKPEIISPDPESQPPPNPEGITFETIFNALGQCYDILYLDPFEINNTGKKHRVFDFYEGEAEKEQDEGVQFWIPKGTVFSPINAGSLENTSNTEILYTEADEQRALSGGLSGLAASLVGLFMPFSLSASFTKIRHERRQERSIYAFSKAEYLDFSLRLPSGSWQDLHLNPLFREAVALLPPTDDQESYGSFIETFGTHISTKVEFGGLVHHQIRLNESTYASMVKRGGDFKTEAEKMFKANFSAGSEKSHFEEVSSHSEHLSFCGGEAKEDIYEWFSTVKRDPTPVKLELLPLHELLTEELFPKDAFISEKQAILAEVSQHYLESESPKPQWELWPSVIAGGQGGSPFADIEIAPHTSETNQQRYQDVRVSEVKVWVGACIDGVQLVLDGDALPLSAHSGEGGQLMTCKLNPGEYIKGVEVTTGIMRTVVITSGPYIASIKFIIEGRSPWIIGHHDSNEAITLDIPENYQVIGFHGRCGKYVDSLGVISIPVKDLNYQLEA